MQLICFIRTSGKKLGYELFALELMLVALMVRGEKGKTPPQQPANLKTIIQLVVRFVDFPSSLSNRSWTVYFKNA